VRNPPSTCERILLYKGTVELLYHEGWHRYYYQNEHVPGVTTITGKIYKELKQWAANETCNYIAENYSPHCDMSALLAKAQFAHKATLDKASDIGSIVHAFAEGWIKGFKPALPSDPAAQNGALAFLDWVKAHEVRFRESEKKIFSRKHGFAGTLDAESYFEDRLAIGDFKTSNGLWPEYRLQTAAYQAARIEEGGEKYGPRWLARFDKQTGVFEHEVLPEEDFEPDFEAFLGIKKVYDRFKVIEAQGR
jgi:hypothetical protein